MTYACSYEVPASEEMYCEVRRLIGDDNPDGLVAHVVVRTDAGLRHLEVSDSEDAWTRFHDDRVEPVVHEVLKAAGFTICLPTPGRAARSRRRLARGPPLSSTARNQARALELIERVVNGHDLDALHEFISNPAVMASGHLADDPRTPEPE